MCDVMASIRFWKATGSKNLKSWKTEKLGFFGTYQDSRFPEIQIFSVHVVIILPHPAEKTWGKVGKNEGIPCEARHSEKSLASICFNLLSRRVSVNCPQNTQCLFVLQHIIPQPMILSSANLGQFLIVAKGQMTIGIQTIGNTQSIS